jgi:pyruvate formate lyase activating enzyme
MNRTRYPANDPVSNPDAIAVAGLTRFSTLDYPGHIAAVVFCQGCPWHCAYCHNPHLQSPEGSSAMPWQEVVDWLDNRHGLLEAVVFSGGEPLLQRGLAGAMWQVRKMGYRVALHTAGIYPERLAGLLPLTDWIGFDVKAPFEDYRRVTGAGSGAAVRRALSFVLASGKPHEIRCTVDESLLSLDDGALMAEQLSRLGVGHLVLQAKRTPEGTTLPLRRDFVEVVKKKIHRVELRGACPDDLSAFF